MAKLYSPAGTEIRGTWDRIPGTALIQNDGEVTRNEDGTFEFEWAGGTDVHWDDQVTLTRNGHRLFVCEDGEIWPENVLELREEEDEDDD
jgi:hypothetical protein